MKNISSAESRRMKIKRLFPAVVLITGVMVVIAYNITAMNEKITRQNGIYINDTIRNTAITLDGVLARSLDSMINIGRVYNNVSYNSIEDFENIERVLRDIRFERIIFAGKDSVSSDSSFVKSEYYLHALNGGSGIGTDIVQTESGEDELKLVIYAPAYDNGVIIGAVYGYFDNNVVSQYMDIEFFGEESRVFLNDSSGRIAASSKKTYCSEGTVQKYFLSTGMLTESEAAELEKSFKNKQSYSFSYKGSDSISEAFFYRLPECGLVLTATFPSKANAKIIEEEECLVRNIIMLIALMFFLYISILIIINRRDIRKLEGENESINGVIQAVTRLFSRFAVVNLNDMTYSYKSPDNFKTYMSCGSYDTMVSRISSRFMPANDDSVSLDDYLSPETIRKKISSENDIYRFEYKDKNDSSAYYSLSILPIDWEGGELSRILLAAQDESDIKQAEIQSREALRKAYESAEKANKAKSEFLSKMSHDIRTPLNGVIGMTSIAMQCIKDSEKVSECLRKIQISGRHLMLLINEVLDKSKIESGKMVIFENKFNLNTLAENVLDILEIEVSSKNQNLTIDTSGIIHSNVTGDEFHIQEIFINILNNAVKYTPSGGTISVTADETPLDEDGMSSYCFVFRDNGIGMEKEFLERIFTPFERAEDSRIDRIQGTGLGMSIVYNIVKLMGGTVTVDSKINEGSVFTVRLNLKYHEETDESGAEEMSVIRNGRNAFSDPGEISFAGRRALLAEDNEISAQVAKELLEMTGIEVEAAENGKKALEMAENSDDGYYDIIFMDIQMPEMNGYEATERIRRSSRKYLQNIPIVAMTANAFAEDIKQAEEAGCSEHMSKPVDIRVLLRMLEKLL